MTSFMFQYKITCIFIHIVGFAEFEPNGHIDCFYCHHEWIGYGIGHALNERYISKSKTR